MRCAICSKQFVNGGGLSKHLFHFHSEISKKQYVIQYILNGQSPLCKCGCGKEPNFYKFQFYEYIKGHGSTQEQVRKKIGAKTKERHAKGLMPESWMKGKTIADPKIKQLIDNLNSKRKESDSWIKNVRISHIISWEILLERCSDKGYCPCFTEDFYKNDYLNNRQPLPFICTKHNEKFSASLVNIQREQEQCPECKLLYIKKSQRNLFYILQELFDKKIYVGYKDFVWLHTGKIGRMELDIYIPDLKLAIEYDGIQHFAPIEFWGGEKSFKKQQQRDKLKNKLISEHPEDIKTFIRIPYTEPITRENIQNILSEKGVVIS